MLKKYITKIERKAMKCYLKLRFDLTNNKELVNTQYNWKVYKYYKKKYKKFISSYKVKNSNYEFSNIVWWCWLQGEDNAPDLCKANLNALRKNLKNRKIVVITNKNLSNYIDIPEYILKKYKKGIISNAHFSDIIRLELLIKYGGTWIDASVLCTKMNEDFFDKPLFMFENFLKEDKSIVASSWFITSEKNNPILLLTRDLLYYYWKKNNFLINYFLFHIFFTLATEKYSDLWKNVHNFSNVPPHILQFEILEKFSEKRWEEICKQSEIHKLTQKVKVNDNIKDSYYNYILNTYL